MCFLLVGAAEDDQLARDFGAGAERAGADPAARQFLGDDAHHQLAETQSAIFLGDADAEGAEVGHRRHGRVGDQIIGEVPAMGVRNDLGIGEAAILVADRVEIGVVERLARPMPCRQRGSEFGAGFRMVGVE